MTNKNDTKPMTATSAKLIARALRMSRWRRLIAGNQRRA